MTEITYTRPNRRRLASDTDNDGSNESVNKSTSKSPSNSQNESQNGHGKLAQEIQDELLICKICLGNYKQPKSLSCLHTFCAGCLERHIEGEVTYKKYSDYRDFTCPLCRKKTSLPVGGVRKLPDNFVVSSLFDMIQKRKSSETEENNDDGSKVKLTCQICKKMGNKKKEAHIKCIDCSKLMCRSCTEMHRQMKVTKLHSLFDLNIEEEVICKVHNEESVRFFCEPCQTCICVLCTFNDHSEHEVTQFTEAVVKYKSEIEKERNNCQNIIWGFEAKLEKITKVEEVIKRTECEIKSMAIKLGTEIQNKEKQLLEEIRNIYGEKLLSIIDSKSSMELQLSELKNTNNMADMVLLRKDVEVLLLKREIQEKLSEMYHISDTDLPSTVSKEVKFIPGILDFGCIQDMDRPLLTRPRSYKEFLESKDIWKTEKLSVDTQTDAGITRPQSSKSSSTIPIQVANKAVNTRSRIVPKKVRAVSLQALNETNSSPDLQSIASSDSQTLLLNGDETINSPSSLRRTFICDQIGDSRPSDIILTASDMLSDYIANGNLDEIENEIQISNL